MKVSTPNSPRASSDAMHLPNPEGKEADQSHKYAPALGTVRRSSPGVQPHSPTSRSSTPLEQFRHQCLR